MRCLLTCFVVVGLLSSTPAKADENEMKAELKALREENEKLKEIVKYMREQFQEHDRELQKVSVEQIKLDGTWVIESATQNGKDISSDKGGVVEFQGNRLTARLPGIKNPIRRELVLSPSVRAMGFYKLSNAHGGPATNTSLDFSSGSYEFTGGTLRIGFRDYGRATTSSDKDQPLWVLKRNNP